MYAERPLRIAIADGSPAFLTAAASYIADLPGFVLAGTDALVGKESFVTGLSQALARLFP